MVGAARRRCSAGAGDADCISVGWGLAWLTLSGKAPHMTAGSNTGLSSFIGINGEFPSSMSLSDLALSNVSRDSSVNNDGSHDDSVSWKGKAILKIEQENDKFTYSVYIQVNGVCTPEIHT